MSNKAKQVARLKSLPADFTWDEATRVLKLCSFEQLKSKGGSGRKFRHTSGVKFFAHEPHPEPILKKYALEDLIEALQNAGEIE